MVYRLSIAAAVMATTVTTATAATTTYTDEAAWRAAAIVFAVETFDGLATGSDVTTLPALGIKFDPLNDGTQPTVQPYGSTGGVARSQPYNLLNDRDFALPGRGPIAVRPIDATEFIFGLGMWNVGGDDTLKLSFYDAADALIAEVTSAVSFGFFGIIDDSGAKRAVVDFVGGNGYAPTDDWQTATRDSFVPNIPVPAALPLLASGLILLAGTARRRA